jgi:Uncharacterised protein conserved in bacteria (DUF2336)
MVENFPPLGFGSFASSTQLMRDSALLRATTELFLEEEAHTPDEVRRYEELTAHLVPKVADQDRGFLAERLAARADAPQAVVRMLAKDKIAIAGPVLRASPVLAALDLLSIIAATGVEHHRIIAERPALTPEVRQALRISADRTLSATLDQIEKASGAPTAAAGRSGASGSPAVATRPGASGSPRTNGSHSDLEAARQRPPAWPVAREPIATRGTSRLDPWSFIRLERPARLRLMAELATRPPIRRYGGPSGRIDRAFRAILSAAQIVGLARSGEREALINAIAGSLELESDLVKACVDDATGEPFAVLLKSLGLDNVQAQQVFLLATPRIGRETAGFFRLCDLYAGMEPSVAEALTEAWRDSRLARVPRHVPHLAENGDRPRPGTGEAARAPSPASAERRTLGSGKSA